MHTLVSDVLGKAYPVGAVYLSVVSTDPATLFGFGTWVQIAGGRFLVGQTGGDTDFDTAEETGGSKTSDALLAHTHGITDPGHNHTQDAHGHAVTDPGHAHGVQTYAHGTGTSANKPEGTNATTAQGTNGATTASAVTGATVGDATATNQASATGVTVDSAGIGTSFSILPPYLVLYIWKRTA